MTARNLPGGLPGTGAGRGEANPPRDDPALPPNHNQRLYVGRTRCEIIGPSATPGVWRVWLEGQDWPVTVHAHEVRTTPEPDTVGGVAIAWGVACGAAWVILLATLYLIAAGLT